MVCGHRFNLCTQVDISPHHKRCSPEPQDPAPRTGDDSRRLFQFCSNKRSDYGRIIARHSKIINNYTPIQVKSCHLCVVSVVACVWLAFNNIVSVIPEGGWTRKKLESRLTIKHKIQVRSPIYNTADLLGLKTTFCPPSSTSRALS